MASYIEIDDIDDIVEESLHDFLKRKNLEKYLPQFQEQGADVIQDVLESVDKDLLINDIGMTSLEANKFLRLIEQYKVSVIHTAHIMRYRWRPRRIIFLTYCIVCTYLE